MDHASSLLAVAGDDPNQLALLVLQSATSGNWRILAALAVVAIVYVIRMGVLHPKALGRWAWLAWFKTDRGGVALNFIVSGLGGVGNALLSKQPISKQLVLAAVVNACIAAGAFVSLKRLITKSKDSTAAPPVPGEISTTPAAPPEAPKTDDSAITTTTTTTVPATDAPASEVKP